MTKTLPEAQALKRKLESDILALIRQFEKETNLVTQSVTLAAVRSMGRHIETVMVHVEVTL